jgi:hypothetical protein
LQIFRCIEEHQFRLHYMTWIKSVNKNSKICKRNKLKPRLWKFHLRSVGVKIRHLVNIFVKKLKENIELSLLIWLLKKQNGMKLNPSLINHVAVFLRLWDSFLKLCHKNRMILNYFRSYGLYLMVKRQVEFQLKIYFIFC